MRAVEGNQRIAALGQINRLLATNANRPCLLSLKILSLLDMKDMQSLEETVTTFVKVAPDNALAHTFASLLELRKNHVQAAVDAAQTAIELSQDSFLGELYDALAGIARGLAAEKKYVAARGHFLFRAMVGGQDEDAMRLLMSISSAEGFPTLLKRNFIFQLDTVETPWSGEFEDVAEDLARGAWRRGLEKLKQLDAEHPGEPTILQNIATAQSYLGYPDAAEAWHRYAMLDCVDFEAAVVAEATSQLLDFQAAQKMVGLVKLSVNISDAGALQERLLSSSLVVSDPVDWSEMREEGSPPPKALFSSSIGRCPRAVKT